MLLDADIANQMTMKLESWGNGLRQVVGGERPAASLNASNAKCDRY